MFIGGIPKEIEGMRFNHHSIFFIARAGDPGFSKLKHSEVVGSHHLLPEDWLPGAKSVIPCEYQPMKIT